MSREADLETLDDDAFMSQEPESTSEPKAGEDESYLTKEHQGGILEDRLNGPMDHQDDSGDSEEEDEDKDGANGEGTAGDEDEDPDADSQTKPAKPSGTDDTTDSADPDHTTPKQTKEGEEPESEQGEGDKETKEEPNYKELYEKMMTPFKANGKEFRPESPEEAVRLMQMGANYTKKMQSLKPNLKMMRMLENNGLLDETKINRLIDLEQKKPEAIQQLIKDSNIDPLEIDTSSETNYKPGNHSVSDQEMDFHTAINDVSATEIGKETLAKINTDWDQASKEIIYKEPQVLSIINEQRASGVYDIISTEVERQRTLGNLTNQPFLHAYKEVGDRLQAEGKLGPNIPAPNQTQVQDQAPASKPNEPQILETRAEPRKKPMANGDKAKAASPGRNNPQKKADNFDPFTMTDDEIMAATDPKI